MILHPTIKQEPLLPAVGRACVRWISSTLAISRAPAKTLSKSLFLPCSSLLTTWLSGGNCVREAWGHQAGISCLCETGGKCAASARCGSAPKSFLTACSCQAHPCHLALHSMSKAGRQRLLVLQGCGQQAAPVGVSDLDKLGMISPG